MVIYIESVFVFNVLVDYLLLFGAARLAGRTVARRRLLLGAAVGGIYAAAQLFLPSSVRSSFDTPNKSARSTSKSSMRR